MKRSAYLIGGLLFFSLLLGAPATVRAAGKGFYPNGQVQYEYLYQDGELREAKWFDEQGQLVSRASYQNERMVQSDGYRPGGILEWQMRILDGGRREVTRYAPDRTIERSYQLLGDQPDGEARTFFSSGQVKQLVTYRKGVLDGPARTYYESGQVQAEYAYRNGQPDGPYRTYSGEGKLTAEFNYAAGKLQ